MSAINTGAARHSNNKKAPFFIMGCVRSGTTILRDVLASHPLLFCPNETHFFRLADPYGTMPYIGPLLNRKIFQEHRRLDDITEEQFRDDILLQSRTRRELMLKYGEAYLKAQNAPSGARWFDKTPQNVYGAFMLAHEFPDARFIHIVRHPLNVITSLRTSEVMVIKETVGAANYWYEAAMIMKAFAPHVGNRLLEIKYEDFSREPELSLERICSFVGENVDELTFDLQKIRPEPHKYRKVLNETDIGIAREICGSLAREYGFEF